MPSQKRQLPKSAPVRKSATRRSEPRGAKSSRARKSTPAVRAPAARAKIPPRPSLWSQLSVDRKLDILGVVLALVGLLTLLSMLSQQNGSVTGWWVRYITQVAGWGSFILPVVLIFVGIWLVLRNVERLPMLSAERIVGLLLLYLNILAWLHLFAGGSWESAAAGQGGGYLGAAFEQATVSALGDAGAVVAFSAWLVIAIALALDISVQEIFHFIQQSLASLARRVNERLENGQPARLASSSAAPLQAQAAPNMSLARPQYPPADETYIPELDNNGNPRPLTNGDRAAAAGSPDLPDGFQPLNTGTTGSTSSSATPAGQTASRARGVRATASANSPLTVRPGEPGAVTKTPPPPPWKLPVIADILDPASPELASSGQDAERAQLIVETLQAFGVPVKVVSTKHGPTVTQFGVEPQLIQTRNGQTRVRVSKIVALADDLALALAAPRIRIQAPVPGRQYVGIEVPNLEVSRVMLREVMESDVFRKLKSPMRFALGKDVAGQAKCYALDSMPHLLIAGTTGSGKSVLVNAILTCLLLNNTPTDLRMILVDPKRVELTGYNGIPHLLAPVVVEAEQVIGALQWVQREMDARYHRFSQMGARNISDYNARNSPPLPYMLVLVDELADLMMLAPDETERALTRLAQLARATGIHLVLATQRPSVDVVTGLIKANFPARVAFAVASGTDSRVILDQPGAERLLGRGDMLFQAPDAAAPVRLQGVWVSDPEIQKLTEYWRDQAYEMRNVNLHTPTATPVNMDMPLNAPLKQTPLFGEEGKGDPIIAEAIKIVREEGKASISMLQRKLRIGYTRAARLVDQLEEQGIIGPAQPTSQVREVLNPGQSNNAETENSLPEE